MNFPNGEIFKGEATADRLRRWVSGRPLIADGTWKCGREKAPRF